MAIGNVDEGSQLDFKRQVDADNNSIAKDIASMTVHGGVILYGVDEGNGITATAITPVPLRGLRERLQQVASSRVQPSPPIQIEYLRASETDTDGIAVLVVSPSLAAPHMWSDRYPIRSGATTRFMDEFEVARLYEQRAELARGQSERRLFERYLPPAGGFALNSGLGGIGTLRMAAGPVSRQTHPQGVRLGGPLGEAVTTAKQKVRELISPHWDLVLLDLLDEWKTRGTIGWEAGVASDNFEVLSRATHAAANYAYHGDVSIEVSSALVIDLGNGNQVKGAFETLWGTEVLSSLAFIGAFYREVPGVAFLDVDLGLNNLDGAVSTLALSRRSGVSSGLPRIADGNYQESGRFSVGALADDPRKAARELLDRLLVSFMGPGPDLFEQLEIGR